MCNKQCTNRKVAKMARQSQPAQVNAVGGAFAKEILDLGDSMSRDHKISLAKFVQDHPELNNREDVSMMIDLFVFYGLNKYRQRLYRLIDKYGLRTVFVSVDYLYESALIGKNDASIKRIKGVVELVDKLTDWGVPASDAEDLDIFITNVDVQYTGEIDCSNIDMLLRANDAELLDYIEEFYGVDREDLIERRAEKRSEYCDAPTVARYTAVSSPDRTFGVPTHAHMREYRR